jgi:hypothetical protein
MRPTAQILSDKMPRSEEDTRTQAGAGQLEQDGSWGGDTEVILFMMHFILIALLHHAVYRPAITSAAFATLYFPPV